MTVMQNPSIEQLQEENEVLQRKVSQRDEKIVILEEQLAWLKRQIFGQGSERDVSHVHADQLQFEGFATLESAEEKKTTIPTHERKAPQRQEQEAIILPQDLPVQTTILDLPEEDKICKETGLSLVKIGEEVTYKLAHKPGSFYLKEIIRPKYAHPSQEEKGILTAPLPDTLLSRCRADESFLAFILTKKFCDHMPLYRICEGLARNGIQISRKLLSHWVIRCGMALKPLYEEMRKRVLSSPSLFIDETPVKIQEAVKCKNGYMWVMVGGQGADPPYRVYDFRENRCHDNVPDMIQGYQGNVHSDKYAAYERLAQQKVFNWCPCMSHVRRKFFEAEAGDLQFRAYVLRKIKYLFMLERVAWGRSEEERLKIRKEKEGPILDELIQAVKAKLLDGRILPKSKLREAIGYFCGLIPYLKNYLKDPWARLDNNVAERAMRPIAIGRKNWLFFGSVEGGEAGGVILSLVQTCRGLGINPEEYLEDVMRRIMGHRAHRLCELLPDQWKKVQDEKRAASEEAVARKGILKSAT